MYADLNNCTLPVNRNKCKKLVWIIVWINLPSELFILLSVMHIHKAECKCYFSLCFLCTYSLGKTVEIYKIHLYILKSSTHEETTKASVLLCRKFIIHLSQGIFDVSFFFYLAKIITISKIKCKR